VLFRSRAKRADATPRKFIELRRCRRSLLEPRSSDAIEAKLTEAWKPQGAASERSSTALATATLVNSIVDRDGPLAAMQRSRMTTPMIVIIVTSRCATGGSDGKPNGSDREQNCLGICHR
jgi:hypothetical protein